MHGEWETLQPSSSSVWDGFACQSSWTLYDHGPIARSMCVFNALPGCSGLGGLGLFFFFNVSVVYKTAVIHLHLLLHCLRLCYFPPMSSTNHCWKHKGKTGIGSSLCVLPNLSESIGRGNPRRTHPNDAGAEPFVAMVTGEMGPGMERGL